MRSHRPSRPTTTFPRKAETLQAPEQQAVPSRLQVLGGHSHGLTGIRLIQHDDKWTRRTNGSEKTIYWHESWLENQQKELRLSSEDRKKEQWRKRGSVLDFVVQAALVQPPVQATERPWRGNEPRSLCKCVSFAGDSHRSIPLVQRIKSLRTLLYRLLK